MSGHERSGIKGVTEGRDGVAAQRDCWDECG